MPPVLIRPFRPSLTYKPLGTSLTQAAFASRIGVPVATLRNWEQGHRSPMGPAQVLLALLDRNPRIVEETLRG
ncbi:helix-turn-helix domain-containing protein [Microvirga sp. 3-52]|nr:helix-turn-helix domain-containing protein [Microvirga sp. 3-52]